MNTQWTQLASHSRRKARQQRGVALITVLLVLLILTAIAFGLMYMANTETIINNNFRTTQSAFAASQAGLQEVRERLMSTNAPPHQIVGPTVLPGAPNSILYLVNPRPGDGVIDPTNVASKFFDDEFCKENFAATGGTGCVGPPLASVQLPPIPSDAPFNGTVAALSYKWVRITAKSNLSECAGSLLACTAANVPGNQTPGIVSPGAANIIPICWDGSHEVPLPAGYATCASPPPAGSVQNYKPVYVITALSLNTSNARRVTQMEVAETPPIITNAALDTQDFVTTQGASVTLNGFDNCQCSCTVGQGNALPNCTFRNGGGACTGSTYAVYTQQTYSGNAGVVAGTNPTIAQNQTQFPWDIQSLAASYASATGAVNVTQPPYSYNCSGGNCGTQSGGTYGTLPSPFPPSSASLNQLAPGEVDQITVVPGSLDIQAQATGSGVLVVNGDLTIHGGLQFYGLVIVTGRLIISGSGQGQAANIIGGVLAGQGTQADTISGGVNLQFDSCALNHNQIKQPPSILAFRELAY